MPARFRRVCLVGLLLCGLTGCDWNRPSEPLKVAVMDPLAADLACACVGGYAQRDYHVLGAYLSNRLDRPIRIVFGDSLDRARLQLGGKTPDLVVGKESVVEFDASQSDLDLQPLCRLTGRSGEVTQTGLFVIQSDDPADKLADLAGRKMLFGPPDSDEKHAAALEALTAIGVALPLELEERGACGDSAIEVAESTLKPGPVAVISGYALPLLEGCGSIERGELRVLARTRPVPFITAFVTHHVSKETRGQLRDVLLSMGDRPALLQAMESRDGFVPWGSPEWTDWRGLNRDGLADRLPDELPDQPVILWKRALAAPGMSGPAATRELVLLAERDPFDTRDVFRCFRASDGETLWAFSYDAKGCLDYGNSPRATPVLVKDRAYVLGAHGELHCLNLKDGTIVWRRHLVADLGGVLPVWGYCSTPLVLNDRIIVNPGGAQSSLVALNRHTGDVLWRAPGANAAYGSFIVGDFGGRRQIVGYDADSLGGWSPDTGRRIWKLAPAIDGDFNVPTPLDINGRLLVATENNGTRLHGFDQRGRIIETPVAANKELAPETSSMVALHDRLFGTGSDLRCLDLNDGLKELWKAESLDIGQHASLIAAGNRVLIFSHYGELLLIDASTPDLRILSRRRMFDEGDEVYAHPALSHGRLFLRNETSLLCVAME